jgi:hypothetical protein
MKKNIFPAVLVVLLSLVLISFANANNSAQLNPSTKDSSVAPDSSNVKEDLSEVLYDSLHLDQAGLSKDAVTYAVKGYMKLDSQGKVNNHLLTIVDFSQNSRQKRFYILDMAQHKLLWNTYVAHGKNTGLDEARNFSNDFNSNESSLGFYLTKSTYSGKHGKSLRIAGLEDGFNSNAEARGIVVHGASYVNESRTHSDYMGRSQGCPALPENDYAKVIDIIKDGSVMFLYSPSQDYLQASSLLN